MLRVEFHCHTIYSKDSLTTPDRLIASGIRAGLDRIVVTDHNTIAGALEAHRLDPQRVIVGEEIMTRQGELLAAFVKEEVPPGLEADEAIARLREQGAFISVSHPFDEYRSGHWERQELERIAPYVDAIETFNARCLRSTSNQQALAFAHAYGLPGTVGSDAHAAVELGRAHLLLQAFSNTAGLKAVLPEGIQQVKLSGFWVHFYSRYAVWKKKQMQAPD